ncbi:MAG: XRE family transcriptional regulator [Myxococcota bacterium]
MHAEHFDPHRLLIARQLSGLSQSALASHLGIHQTTVSLYECGTKTPNDEMICGLAKALSCSVQFLTPLEDLATMPAEHLSEVFFRSLRSTPSPDRLRALGICGAVELLAAILLELGHHLPKVALPLERGDLLDEEALPETDAHFLPKDKDGFTSFVDGIDPLHAAYQTRQAWGLGDAPIPNLLSLLEQHGVLTVTIPDMNAGTVDAFSYWKGMRPIVALNHQKRDPFRSRFDAAHELGHLLMHRGLPSMERESKQKAPRKPSQIMEDQANAFAGELLVPGHVWISQAPRSANPYAYLPGKKRWGVSVKALITRSHRVGILNDKQYQAAHKRYSKLGWNRGEPNSDTIEHEQPSLLGEFVAAAAAKHHLSPKAYLQQLLLLPGSISELIFPDTEKKLHSLNDRRSRMKQNDPRIQGAIRETLVPVYNPELLPLGANQPDPPSQVVQLFPNKK